MTEPLLPISPSTRERLAGRPLVLLLDVDGTLSPIAPRPEVAGVPPETRKVVASLASLDDVRVALVSGRAAADARRMVGVANVWAIGNHGYEVTGPDGEEEVPDSELRPFRLRVTQAARRLEPLVVGVPGVILEDKGWTLSIHYRLADREVVPRLRDAVADVIEKLGLKMTEGKEVLEVRPPARVDKGTAVLMMGMRLGGFAEHASIAFLGDDVTDEDAFRALRHRSARAVTVRVERQPASTAAEFAVRDTDEVRQFLEWLALERRRLPRAERAG